MSVRYEDKPKYCHMKSTFAAAKFIQLTNEQSCRIFTS